jgi:hypothetical protein
MNTQKNLLTCSLDELLTEKQNAIEAGNIDRYRECNEIISTYINNKTKELDIVEMYNSLKDECEQNAMETTMGEGK